MRLSFRFRWIPFAAAVLVAAVGISLGNWQMRRADEKLALQQAMRSRAAFVPVNANALDPGEVPEEFRRVTADGEFVGEWAVYLENRPLQGKAGFYLLMPFRLAGTDRAVLVLRGWFPRDPVDRTRIPVVPVPAAPLRIEGQVRHAAGRLMQLGEAETLAPGAIAQNAGVDEFRRASKLPLQTFIIEQSSDTGDGLVRDWPLPAAGMDTHRGYAFQWYSLAAASLIFFLVTGFRRASKRSDSDPSSQP